MTKSKSSRHNQAKTFDISNETEERIRRRAYELHLERGGAHGFALDDWLRAEAEILGTDNQFRTKAAGSK